MSRFVDTGLFYALQNRRAQNHEAATVALSVANSGQFGRQYTSEYVYDEAVTLVRSHRDYPEAKLVGDRILGVGDVPEAYEVLTVTTDDFDNSRDIFETYRDHSLSFTDATIVALMDAHSIDSLLTFDANLDGIVDWLDPGGIDS